MEKKTIGQFIAVLRKANGMTQQELADSLNVSNKAVSRWEREESAPDITLIPALAEILGVTCDELLKGERITYAQQSEKKEVKVEKQVKALIHREILKYKTMMWIAIAVALAGPIVMWLLENTIYWLYDACFAVMLLFEVVAFVIETIAVTRMRDIKEDSEVFADAEDALLEKYNWWLGDSSFGVYFLIIVIVSGIYINNSYMYVLPYISAFLFWILLCVGIYLFVKNRYVTWITGVEKQERNNKNERKAEVDVHLMQMNRIQIMTILLYGLLFFFAPYLESSPTDKMVDLITNVLATGLLLVNVVSAIVFIIKEKENRRDVISYGIRNILLLPSAFLFSQIHSMLWIYDMGESPQKCDSWYWEYLIYAVAWGLGVVVVFTLMERLMGKSVT